MLFDNLKSVVKDPRLGVEFAWYGINKLIHQGKAVRRIPGNVKLTGLSGFSEFHSCTQFLNAAERSFLSELPKMDGVVIDIGANLGVFAIMLAKHFASSEVHAFEPNPSTCDALQMNLLLNECRDVTVHNMAVCDHDGTVLFEANPKSRGTCHISNAAHRHSMAVPCVKLDSFARGVDLNQIAFLKIDVEGYESLVLRGAADILAHKRVSVIYFEVCPPLAVAAGFNPEEPARIIAQSGYQLYRFTSQGEVVPANVSEIGNVALENWIAMRQ